MAGTAWTTRIRRLTVAAPYRPATTTQARKKTVTWNPIGSGRQQAPHEAGHEEPVVEPLVGGQRRGPVGEGLVGAERLHPALGAPQEHLEDHDVDVDRDHEDDQCVRGDRHAGPPIR